MPEVIPYRRDRVIAYAHRWAYLRNPEYYSFNGIGGDCTNFVSQCIFAGTEIMNYIPVFGWYYRSASDRSPSWTGVQYLYNFIVRNPGVGPFGAECSLSQLEPGDFVQLNLTCKGRYEHTAVVTETRNSGSNLSDILVAAHSDDCDCRPLSTYSFCMLRCVHIEGVRK